MDTNTTTITVTVQGTEATFDFQGFPGASCLQAAEQIKVVLSRLWGIELSEEQFTPKLELLEAWQQQSLGPATSQPLEGGLS